MTNYNGRLRTIILLIYIILQSFNKAGIPFKVAARFWVFGKIKRANCNVNTLIAKVNTT